MACFRSDAFLNQLTPDDRIEIPPQILLGSSDLTNDLLDRLLSDYCVAGLEVVELGLD
jgi:hypothetical protein